MYKTFSHSHFLPEAFGHGGNKRSAQIEELVINAGIEISKPDFSNSRRYKNKLAPYLNGARHNASGTNLKKSYAIGRYINQFESFAKNNVPHPLLWESTIEYFLLLPKILSERNIPVIALPHNLESLVAGTKSVFSGKQSPAWLTEEVEYFSYCKKVFTISQEESWLLSNMGIDAQYLPYYPPAEALEYLKQIRQKRSSRPINIANNEILLLGTFHNPPTLSGYKKLLDQLTQHNNITVNIAGFGSEGLVNLYPNKNFKIWGSVSNSQLSELITLADLGIIHQEPSSGALTRIPELIISGLPLLANVHAARSCSALAGVNIYHSFEELSDNLSGPVYPIPALIDRPAAEQDLIDFIKTLHNKS